MAAVLYVKLNPIGVCRTWLMEPRLLGRCRQRNVLFLSALVKIREKGTKLFSPAQMVAVLTMQKAEVGEPRELHC